MKRKTTLRTRIIAAFLGLAIGPLLTVAVFLSWQNYQDSMLDVRLFQQEDAEQIGLEVSAFFEEVEHQLAAMDRFREFARLPETEQKKALSILTGGRTFFQEVALVDPSGRERFRISGRELIPADGTAEDGEERTFLRAKGSGKAAFSRIRFDRETGEPISTCLR